MNVYLIEYDHNSDYDHNFLDTVYKTYEEAEKYLNSREDLKYVRGYWISPDKYYYNIKELKVAE